MGRVVRHTRHRHKRATFAGQPRRMRRLPMVIPWALLLGMAAAVYVLSERYIAGQPRFTSCGWILWRNCVVDGDTIRYAGEKIRVLGIDAPEISDPKCPTEAALGLRAKQRLVELMNAGPVEVIDTGGKDVDAYGRKLRVVTSNGWPVGERLVAEGLARPWGSGRRSWCE